MIRYGKVLQIQCTRKNDSNELGRFHQRLVHRRLNLKTMLNRTLIKFSEFHEVTNNSVKEHDITLCYNEIKLLSTSIRSLDKTISISRNAQNLHESNCDDLL